MADTGNSKDDLDRIANAAWRETEGEAVSVCIHGAPPVLWPDLHRGGPFHQPHRRRRWRAKRKGRSKRTGRIDPA